MFPFFSKTYTAAILCLKMVDLKTLFCLSPAHSCVCCLISRLHWQNKVYTLCLKTVSFCFLAQMPGKLTNFTEIFRK